MSPKVKALDTLLAAKALNFDPSLLPNDRTVGCALLDHFNRTTGRCDPSIERLAKLLGICTRTVIRSIKRLVAARYFTKSKHGGYSNRNSYQPNWSRFEETNRQWRSRFSARSSATAESVGACQPSHEPPAVAVTQTYLANLSNQTCSAGSANKKKDQSDKAVITPGQPARQAAHRRWDGDLLARFRRTPKVYSRLVELISPELAELATQAEAQKRGEGIAFILMNISSEAISQVTP